MTDHTPVRTVRVPEELWGPFTVTALANGTNASAEIRNFIQSYISAHPEGQFLCGVCWRYRHVAEVAYRGLVPSGNDLVSRRICTHCGEGVSPK